MTPEQLGALAGIVLSLAFSYIPGLSERFAALTSKQQSLIMAGLLFGVSAGAFALSCADVVNAVECSKAGALGLLNVFVAALVANQGTYLLSPQRTQKINIGGVEVKKQ